MKILAVSVGRERDIGDEADVRSAIFKTPVDGKVMLRLRGLDGDVQTDVEVHGGFERAVLVYSWDNYSIWRQELGRDDLAFGEFGENFTVEGMVDGDVHIGDLYKVGGAVVEITHGRIPCDKLGIRFSDPGFPKTFLKSLRTGFFLRVLEEGIVGAGDSFRRLAVGPERITVKEATDLLFGDAVDPEKLAALADLSALALSWRTRAELKMQRR
jgi:MOSC domain-containing protein YiiM